MTMRQVYDLARGVGLPHGAAVTATAIAVGESGLDPAAVGDRSLANSKWGPSIGLWQVRSLNAERGTGRSRDASRLADPAFNARAMHSISNGGTTWSPWSVYTSGKHRQHIAAVEAAVSGSGAAPTVSSPTFPVGGTFSAQTVGYDAQLVLGPFGLPVNPFKIGGYAFRRGKQEAEEALGDAGEALGDAVEGAAGAAVDKALGALVSTLGPLVLSTVAIGAGATLVVLGLWTATKPAVQSAAAGVAGLTAAGAPGGRP